MIEEGVHMPPCLPSGESCYCRNNSSFQIHFSLCKDIKHFNLLPIRFCDWHYFLNVHKIELLNVMAIRYAMPIHGQDVPWMSEGLIDNLRMSLWETIAQFNQLVIHYHSIWHGALQWINSSTIHFPCIKAQNIIFIYVNWIDYYSSFG